ncbi:NAD(P)/FAD-dependent oxidoreductase [Oryzobacter terrae]|uniref:NAD(P)/FAD-dependent oxidoreductase n=1 Tax=Oryzobacter terrae TaxID=1620385 RepID=UPI00366C47D0
MTRVVLLGGGYVTLHAHAALARGLRREIRSGAVQLVVLTADPAHSYHGFTGEVLAGLLPFARTRTPVAGACPRARVEHGVVVEVDRKRRTVTWRPAGSSDTRTMTWDHLVVGTGGREPAALVPGLAEHGWTLRSPGDIERLAARVGHLAGRSLEGDARPPLVLVAGGGLAGVELAAAVADRGRGRLRVELVHAGDRLVPELAVSQPRLARRAAAELERLGVRVRLGVRLVEVTAGSAWLSDGTLLPTADVIATTGQRPVRLPGLGDELRDLRGRLLTGSDLSVGEGVWAAGDAARVLHPVTGEPVAANALWAIKGGHHVGTNVARVVRGRPAQAFRYRGLGRAASFGLGHSVAELYGVPLTGTTAWVLRLAFFLRFMPDRRQALRTLADTVRAVRGTRVPAPPVDRTRPRTEREARVA